MLKPGIFSMCSIATILRIVLMLSSIITGRSKLAMQRWMEYLSNAQSAYSINSKIQLELKKALDYIQLTFGRNTDQILFPRSIIPL